MAQLLVSVRTAEEADTAISGGADIIDVKEPARGSLGRPDLADVREVVARVGGRRPVSVALGELIEWNDRQAAEYPLPEGLAFVKIGLTACGRRDWRSELVALREKIAGYALSPLHPPEWIAVAYADAAWAQSPMPMEIAVFAALRGFRGVLLDTWEKNENHLADWMTDDELAAFVAAVREQALSVALAGSLRQADIVRLAPLNPDVFAVRGAACREGDRGAEIDAAAVARLAAVIRSPATASASSSSARPAG